MDAQNQTNPTPYVHRRRFMPSAPTIIIAVLLVVIAAMTMLWQPWNGLKNKGDRTIDVTGTATVKAEPDQYMFMPTYRFVNADKKAANEAATKKSTEIVAGLKKLSVQDKSIKTNISSYDSSIKGTVVGDQPENTEYTATLLITVTLTTRDEAQKIQDYLADTGPEGQITPQATFSESKRKQLESNARDDATKDARAKADQSAKNLGFKVGAVKQVNDGAGFGAVPLMAGSMGTVSTTEARDVAFTMPTIDVQPGENELSYSVSVTYYLR